MPKKPNTIDLGTVEIFRNQAMRDAIDAAKARNYQAAAVWDAWADAYNHLLVQVRNQQSISKHRGEG